MTQPGFAEEEPPEQPVALDPEQLRIVQAGDAGHLLVVGAPGSGKTTVLVETLAHRILEQGWDPAQVLALTPARATATLLRDRIARRVGRTVAGPGARSVNSLAFDIVARAARTAGAPPVRLMTGGEEDSDIADLLAAGGDRGDASWPEPLTARVRGTRGFRTELRELRMRMSESGLAAQGLVESGRRHGHPEWIAAGRFFERYEAALAVARPDQLDSVELVRFAAAALARGEAGEVAGALRLVLVDDLQEAPESAMTLIAALARRGVRIVAFGDPDVATSAFRGAEADLAVRLAGALQLPSVPLATLPRVYRHGERIRGLVAGVTRRIGTAGIVGHREARACRAADEELEPALLLRSSGRTRQAGALSRHLRGLHLLHGIGYDRMAVIVRSGKDAERFVQALTGDGVPARGSVAQEPLRASRAARALLTVVDVGCRPARPDPETCEALLLGPYGGLDRLGLRRLRLALRAEEIAGGSHRTADELIAEAIAAPGRLATLAGPQARAAEGLTRILATVRAAARDGASIEELLWCAWSASGLAETLRRRSTGDDAAAAQADRDLDAVGAVFAAAARFVERRPAAPATVFLEETLGAEVPEDTLAPRAAGEHVLVATPSASVGWEADIVIVAGLQDGVWPDLRPRGSLLHAQELAGLSSGIAAGVLDERRLVLDGELRMFALALSRACRQVVLAVVENDDESAGPFLGLLPDLPSLDDAAEAGPLDLPRLTGLLRRRLTQPGLDEAARKDAANGLARLAEAGVPGAAADEWLGRREPSTSAAFYGSEEVVPISPSKLDDLESSPLDWFIESVCADAGSPAAGIGTLLHWALQTVAEPSVDRLWQAVEDRWLELAFDAPWVEGTQRAAARRLVLGLAEYLEDAERAGVRVLAAEKRFTLPLDRAVVRGSVDRLESTADGRLVIMDLKTGRPITNKAEIARHPQLGVYQLALRLGLVQEGQPEHRDDRPGGAKLVYVREGVGGKQYREALQEPLDEIGADEMRDRIQAAAALLRTTSFTGPRILQSRGLAADLVRALRRVAEITHG